MSDAATTTAPPTSAYADWKAPGEDGQFLIWPDPATLLAQTRQNQRRLAAADQVLLQGVPLSEVRRTARLWLGHDPPEQLLVASGHQTELEHPGVWAKHVLINALAPRLSAVAYHVAVDTDAPKHLHLRWPGASHPITDDHRLPAAPWSGLLDAPTPRHLDELQQDLAAAAQQWGFMPLAGEVLSSMKRLTLESSDLATVLVNAIHQLEWRLGLRHHALLASPLWLSPAYLLFIHHLLARAGQFTSVYNQALREYRRQHGIKTLARPWPDLRCTSDQCEAPFWLDHVATGVRHRAAVRQVPQGYILELGEHGDFVFDPAAEGWSAADRLARFLTAARVRLSPRALTLTAFLRLLVVDQFVHGIGGGRYDQVTDTVLHRLLGIAPPFFSVTTATLYFPQALGQRRVNLHPLLQEGRRLRHGLLDPRKMDLVARIESAPRFSTQRREIYAQMHAMMAQAVRHPAYEQWQQRLEEARKLQASQRALFDRELFFALQPESRLHELIDRYEAAFPR